MFVEECQKWLALPFRPSLEMRGESRIDIERVTSGFGMADHDRVYGILGRQFRIDEAILSLRTGFVGAAPKTCRIEWTARNPRSARLSPSDSAS